MNKVIFETEHFIVCTPSVPHISREEGGHIYIKPKRYVCDRTELAIPEAIEVMLLTMAVGKAYTNAMRVRGVDIERLNYQDNGNWPYLRGEKPCFHIHIYGRAKNANIQEFGKALFLPVMETGFYNDNVPLDDKDIEEIQAKLMEDPLTKEMIK